MARPIYETSKDRAKERAAIEFIAPKVKCDGWHSMPKRYPLDFALTRDGNVEFFAEVKCRTNAHDAYPDYMLSMGKFVGLLEMQTSTNIPSLLVVDWTDCVGVLRLPVPGIEYKIGGRKDRGDDQDVEPVVHIPVDRFSKFRK